MTDKLDGDLLVVEEIGSFENDAKGALTNLLTDTVMDTYDIGRRRSHGCALESYLEDWIGCLRDGEGASAAVDS